MEASPVGVQLSVSESVALLFFYIFIAPVFFGFVYCEAFLYQDCAKLSVGPHLIFTAGVAL